MAYVHRYGGGSHRPGLVYDESKWISYSYHMGGMQGYESIIAIDFAANNAIILLPNSSDVPRRDIVDSIEKTLLDDKINQNTSVR